MRTGGKNAGWFVCVLAASSMSALAAQPLGIPATGQTPDSRLVGLGKKLFFDKRLSRDGTVSCATCHVPEKAFTDGKPVAVGVGGQSGTRNTPSLLNAVFVTHEFWDGRRDTLEDQALDPLMNPREQGLESKQQLVAILEKDTEYKKGFAEIFPGHEAITPPNIASALATYERSLLSGNSAFDRYRYGHDNKALSVSQIRGLKLFEGHAQCASCHTLDDKAALLTDNDFHRLGVGFPKIEKELPALTQKVMQTEASKLDQLVLDNPDVAELGHFVVSRKVEDIGKFKTPGLRNVALTAPYMHDGSVPTLRDAIDREIYYRSAEAGRPLVLSIQEREDLLNFLNALTSDDYLASTDEHKGNP
jgi:cytochrome c peroxidase